MFSQDLSTTHLYSALSNPSLIRTLRNSTPYITSMSPRQGTTIYASMPWGKPGLQLSTNQKWPQEYKKQYSTCRSRRPLLVLHSRWLAEAFSSDTGIERQAWKHQFSVTPAYHGADLSASFAVDTTVPNIDFRNAFQKVFGNFSIHDTPTISLTDATSGYKNATVPSGIDDKIQWPAYTMDGPCHLDFNPTGGQSRRQLSHRI